MPVVGEVPAALQAQLLADLEQRTGAQRSAFVLVRAEAVIWNDGSLGCPKPGEVYIQALVNGYWVVYRIGEREYDYRAAENGVFFLCEQPQFRSLREIPPTAVIIVPGPPGDTAP